jgi:hypothetical protein
MKKKDPRVLLSMAIIKNARLISDIGHSEETDVLEKRMIEYKNVMAAIQLQYDSLPLQPSQEWTRGRLNSAFALFNVLCEEAVKEKVGKKVEVEEQTV